MSYAANWHLQVRAIFILNKESTKSHFSPKEIRFKLTMCISRRYGRRDVFKERESGQSGPCLLSNLNGWRLGHVVRGPFVRAAGQRASLSSVVALERLTLLAPVAFVAETFL